MELLELKSVWEAVVDEAIAKYEVDEFVVEKSIKKDSRSTLAKIKRVMYFKFFIGSLFLVVCPVMLIGSFVNPVKFAFYEWIFDITDNRIFLATVTIFMAAMLSWNISAFREIQRFESSTRSVRKSLEKLIDIMGKTIKLNVYSGTAFNAVALGWLCYLANNKLGFVEGTFQKMLLIAGVIVSAALIFYHLSRYEQKVKFGNYLDQLKSNLTDLTEK